MKIFVTTFLELLISIQSFSQKPPVKFGNIPMEDMMMTIYEKDSSARAVILVDYAETTGFAVQRHVRIKILKKDGLEFANAIVPLFGKGKIESLKASTYNLVSGRIVETEMSKEGVFKENFIKNIDFQKFTLPNVKEGSVIEYYYKVNVPGIPNWEFQKSIPVRWSEYWAIIPDAFTFEKYMQGYVFASTYEVSRKMVYLQGYNQRVSGYPANVHHWITENVPAFKPEPFMTSERDCISKLNFVLSSIHFPGQPVIEFMSSWKTLNDELLMNERFGKVIAKSDYLKDEVERITTGIADPMKKIEAIHGYVRQNMEWNNTNGILTEDLKRAVEKKLGTSADINFMLASMLEKAGFLVDMVILSTRDHGFVRRQSPVIQQFNYVVCAARVNGKPVLLDATEKFLPYAILPMRCLNSQGLMISTITPDWIDIAPKAKARTVVEANLMLDPGGGMKGKMQFTFDGYDAFKMRKEYHTKGEDGYIKSFFQSKDWQIEKNEFQNVKELSLPLKEIHEVSIGEHSSVAGDIIYLNPFVHSKEAANPFKPETREFPVDFGSPIEKIFIIRITLPSGYVIDEMPQSKIFRLPDNSAKYTYDASQAGNIITITSYFQINKSLFVQYEYPDLREFYNQVIAKQAELIVLKKN